MENNNRYSPRYHSRRIIPRISRFFGWAFIGLMFVCLFALIFGFIVKWLWNILMPAVFGLGAITFWQAFALVVLAKLLFGSFGGPRSSYRKSWHTWDWHHDWAGSWNRSSHRRESIKRRFNDWKYYHQFWEDEGREAFKAYMDRKDRADKDTRNEKPEENESDKTDDQLR